jgi:hypothetical protein
MLKLLLSLLEGGRKKVKDTKLGKKKRANSSEDEGRGGAVAKPSTSTGPGKKKQKVNQEKESRKNQKVIHPFIHKPLVINFIVYEKRL